MFTSVVVLLVSLILDNERWKQADVPAEFQDLVNHISTTGRWKKLHRFLSSHSSLFIASYHITYGWSILCISGLISRIVMKTYITRHSFPRLRESRAIDSFKRGK